MPNGSLLPPGRIKERDWLTAFACRIVIRPAAELCVMHIEPAPATAAEGLATRI